MKPAHYEHFFIEAIKDDFFRINVDGQIWRTGKKGHTKNFIKIQEREMKCINSGYIQINIKMNGNYYRCYAHRLVWIFFNGEIPDDKQINHINGIKTDNRLCNLELVTASRNLKHAFGIGLKNLRGENHSHSKLTDNDIREIRERYLRGETQTQIANDFNIIQQNVSCIVNRKSWIHI